MPIVESISTIDGEEVAIFLEVDDIPAVKNPYEDLRSVDTTAIVVTVRDVFGEAMKLTRNCAKRVVENIKQMDEAIRPEEFEVKLSIKLDSEVGAFIAKASAGSQVEVTMKWIKRGQS